VAKNKWISSAKFKKLKLDDKVVIRFMIGDAHVAGEPVINLIDPKADNAENIDIRFSSGPSKGKTLKIIREMISTSKESFPPRKEYIKK
tara:strand:- start:496 stop:762 length:267 start_codon:yes stop_codon:yes gene_type:complete